MSQQVVDVRSVWAILRRHWKALVVAAVLGAGLGVGVTLQRPPTYSSTSMVLLPATANNASSSTAHDIATQVQIAGSVSVLGPAAEAMSPPMSVTEVEDRVEVTAPTSDVLQFTAQGQTAEQAEALAKAVAEAHVSYLDNAASSLSAEQRTALADRQDTLKKAMAQVDAELQKTNGRLNAEDKASPQGLADAAAFADLTAQRAKLVLDVNDLEKQLAAGSASQSGQSGGGATVIQNASPAERAGLVERLAIDADLGAAFFVIATAFFLVLKDRRDQRLRLRDHIAEVINIPVVASLGSRTPRSASGWLDLMHGYDPGNVDRWGLRQLLRLVTSGTRESLVRKPDADASSQPVVVVSLAGDHGALAAGPQFASFVASLGVSTELIAAQPHDAADALWAACTNPPGEGEVRPELTVSARRDVRDGVTLVVLLAVLDRHNPELYLDGTENAVTLLAVSAGFATAADLANVAVAADFGRHPLDGIIVVDPDPLDRTSGRLIPPGRSPQVALPTLMTGRGPSESPKPLTHGKSQS